MKIYNSLTKRKNELKEKKIGIYVCGPTVYDEPHIGHARSAYTFDIIVRYLRFRRFKIKFVRNVTDIDDKIIDRARLEPRGEELKRSVKEIAIHYLKRYRQDMDLLGLVRPDAEPKATETIPDMIKFIKILIRRDFAYQTLGGVYFNVRKFKDYGRLSGQSLDQMEEGARVAIDKNKKDPLDFALWKTSKEDEPSWPSPWGEGRPGWHIECSVMSTKFLGNNFLIHGGGLDLIFPHHENEIAQTVCAGKKSAKYWMHNGLLTINGQKMSKSLGNFITIRDFHVKYKDLDLLKLLFLSSHYRHPVDYTEGKIKEMARMKERIDIFLQKVSRLKESTVHPSTSLPSLRSGLCRAGSSRSTAKKHTLDVNKFRNKFIDAMDNDFNTPEALSGIFESINAANKMIRDEETLKEVEVEALVGLRDFIIDVTNKIFGLSFPIRIELEETIKVSDSTSLTVKEIDMLIKKRDEARKNKDFKKADNIRTELLGKGIILEDTKEGTIWRRKP